MKKHIVLQVMVLAFILVLTLLSQASALEAQQNPSGTVSVASWSKTYTDVQEMFDDSDVVVTAKVITQISEAKYDLVFTISTLEVEHIYKGGPFVNNRITVRQTGGLLNGEYKNIIIDAPLLNIGQSYLLYLQDKSSERFSSHHFSIAGGNQGVGLVTSKNEVLPLSGKYRDILSGSIVILDDYFFPPKNITSSTDTPMLYYWINKTNISVYISSSISSNYGSTMQNHITDAVYSWNNLCTRYYSITTGVAFDVGVFMNDYGTDDWDGLTTFNSGASYSGITYANVSLNNHGQASGPNYWRAVACHELGHALGLDHNANYQTTQTVMASDTPKYYNPGGTPPYNYNIYMPQAADINGLVGAYGTAP